MNARNRYFGTISNGSGRLLTVLAIAMLLALATVLGAIWLTKRAEREFENRAVLQVKYETQLFEIFTRNLLQRFDQVLMLLREEVLEDGPPADIATWSAWRGVLREPLFQIAVIGADGKLLATTENASNVGVDLSDREHFSVHRETDADRMFISKPLVGRASGRLSLNVSRPVRNAGGQFLGVVVVSIDPQLFSNFLEILGEPNNTLVNLFGKDGIIRARAPSVPGQQFIGGSIAGFEVEALVKVSSEGTFRAVSRLDKVERVFAFRRLDDISLTVLVAKNTDAVFADFYKQRRLYLTIGFVSAAFIIGLAVLFEIYLRAQDRIRVGDALAALQNQQSTDLIGIMDGCGAALVQTDADGQIVACNSVFAVMFGIADRGDLVGAPLRLRRCRRRLGDRRTRALQQNSIYRRLSLAFRILVYAERRRQPATRHHVELDAEQDGDGSEGPLHWRRDRQYRIAGQGDDVHSVSKTGVARAFGGDPQP